MRPAKPACHAGLVRWVVCLLAAILATPCLADPRTQKLLDRLADQASALERAAPHLITEETLHQRASGTVNQKTRRFHPRIETNPKSSGPEWQTREIRSEYAFTTAGNPPTIREIRKVLAVDGKTVNTSERSLGELLRSLQTGDDRSRRKLLEDFEKHGLIGTVTDFGQLLLLFDRRRQDIYEFSAVGERLLGAERCLVFRYAQHDGPGALTIWETKGRVDSQAVGEIWVARDDYRIIRITIRSVRNATGDAVRDEAEVDYTTSYNTVPVPIAVTHREYRNGRLTAENLFSYAPFRRFGQSPK